MTIICALHDPEYGCTWVGSDTASNYGGVQVETGTKWILSSCGTRAISGAGEVWLRKLERK